MKLFEMLQDKFKGMSPNRAYDYAKIHGPDCELGHIIATNPYYSYYYARDVLRSRFREGEKAILSDPYWSQLYAKDVLGRRWLKAESLIRNSIYWNLYKKYFNIK